MAPARPAAKQRRAAGHTRTAAPAQKVVTATRTVLSARTVNLAEARPAGDGPSVDSAHDKIFVDFAHVKRQLPIARLLDHLGIANRLCGAGPQRRGPCPIHRGDARGRTFSVQLDANVFACFDPACAAKGDVIELWACVNGMSRRQAALDLVQTFGLEPAPRRPTAKRRV